MSNSQRPSFTVECMIMGGQQQKKAALSLFDHYLEIHNFKEELFCTYSQSIFYERIRGVQFLKKPKTQRNQNYQTVYLQIGKREIEIKLRLEDSESVRSYLKVRVPQTNFSQNYKVLETIRRTQNGEVCKCLCYEDNKVYAAKIMKDSQFVEQREIQIHKILAKNPHEHVQAMKEYYIEDDNAIIIFPFLSGGTLHQFMASQKEKKQKLDVKKIFKQILKGLSFIHSLGIIHRDMKMDNIMVEEYECSRLSIQIIDFGFAVVKGFSDYFNERCGTVGYLAPEIVNEEEYNELCDIFSLSQIFHILLTGNPMYDRGMENARIIRMSKNNLFKIDNYLIHNDKIIDLLEHMMLNKQKRYSAEECLQHEYFRKLQISEKMISIKNLQFSSPFDKKE